MINCACTWLDGSAEPGVVFETYPTARRRYRCCECRDVINPGEKHECHKGVWDGEWSTYRTCMACAQIRRDYEGEGYVYGELGQQIYDCLGFDYRKVE